MSPITHDLLLAAAASAVGAALTFRIIGKKLAEARRRTNQLLAFLDVSSNGSLHESISATGLIHSMKERIQSIEFNTNLFTGIVTVTLHGRERAVHSAEKANA